jgi:hypothetical protein
MPRKENSVAWKYCPSRLWANNAMTIGFDHSAIKLSVFPDPLTVIQKNFYL